MNYPEKIDSAMVWQWEDYNTRFQKLIDTEFKEENLQTWMADWSTLLNLFWEVRFRHESNTLVDVNDQKAKEKFDQFLDQIFPKFLVENQKVTEMLVQSGLKPNQMSTPLKKMMLEYELYRDENVPLLTQEEKLNNEYFELTGAFKAEWEGKEVPIPFLFPKLEENDRAIREKAWKTIKGRRLQARDDFADLWARMMDLRQEIASNAGLDYRSYRWRMWKRIDYTPEDAKQFHRSVEKVVMPLVRKMNQKRKQLLELDHLRDWDLSVDIFNKPPLKPFQDGAELIRKSAKLFQQMDPTLARYFDRLVASENLDLESRDGKAPGAYQSPHYFSGDPFIFANVVGTDWDLSTFMHEFGHAIHFYESLYLPYYHQKAYDFVGLEFSEVASTAMQYISSKYFDHPEVGFYTEEESARSLFKLLNGALEGFRSISMIDSFQHWVYENPQDARDIDQCDHQFAQIMDQFDNGTSWEGLEQFKGTNWYHVLHIFVVPFYFLDYGLAEMGALQIWMNAQKDEKDALRQYRQALALGSTRNLPDLYATAGAKFAFDEVAFKPLVEMIETKLDELEGKIS